MAKVAFLLMVHKEPERVVRQARALTAHGDCVAIHVDARMPAAQFRKIREGLAELEGVTLARRVRCGWGEWSLVAASLNMIRAARRDFDGITHYFLMSGDCCPTKSRGYLDRFLADGRDHIEAHDFFDSDWIKTGLREDRLIYRHWFNERARKGLFYASLNMQRWFRLKRELPPRVRVHIGSQWWVLRAATVERIMELIARRRELVRFFRTTWIPDETFFQSLVAKLVPPEQISSKPPTTLLFSDYGMPVVFHADHEEFLRGQPQPFARKISSHAADLQHRLLERFANWDSEASDGGAETGIYAYLSGRGRVGRRYARRFWERAIAPRDEAEVLVVACKLWHVGHAVEHSVARATGLAPLGYVFDENTDIALPLGNLEHGLFKRNQHRQALLNLILNATDGDRILLSVDPGRRDVLEDIVRFAGEARILVVDRPLSQAHLQNHAERVGLVHANSGNFERAEIVAALSEDFHSSIADLRERFRGRVYLNDPARSRDDNATDIGHFLRIPRGQAERLASEVEQIRQ